MKTIFLVVSMFILLGATSVDVYTAFYPNDRINPWFALVQIDGKQFTGEGKTKEEAVRDMWGRYRRGDSYSGATSHTYSFEKMTIPEVITGEY